MNCDCLTPDQYIVKNNAPVLDSTVVWWRPKKYANIEWPWICDNYEHVKVFEESVDIIILPLGKRPSRHFHLAEE